MAKFTKRSGVKQEIPTSSMPDVVFMLLFFFMVTTQLRDNSIKVQQRIPEATQMRKLQRKGLVSYLYIGAPKHPGAWGKEPRIQANDVFIDTKEVNHWVNAEITRLEPGDKDAMIIALKVHDETRRGIIVDVETELKKANARRLLYSTVQRRSDL
jgi:biopolymer transport protein ExbD